jgi:hypothetical protein
MAGTSAPPIRHCRDLTPIGERLASRLYSAHSDRLGRAVTVTVYPALPDHDARRRFDDAARDAQRLAAHPSALAIHDWGHAADGRPWVVTDPQPPETVEGLLRSNGPFSVEQALRIGVLVAGALETAHRAGIVHGDLSPARLVIDSPGMPLVADVGLAEFGTFPGLGALYSPVRYFAPPEVLEHTGVSVASDVYSLAATVYALLAGRAPHEKPPDITDSNASLLLRILQIEVPPIVRPGEAITGIEAALRPALAHAAEKRPLRVLDLAWSLQDVQRSLGLPVVEAVVLDLGNPERPATPPAPAVAPQVPHAPVAPVPDSLPAWYTDPPPNHASAAGGRSAPPAVQPGPPAGGGEPTGGEPGTGEPTASGEPAGSGGAWAAPSNGHRPDWQAPEPLGATPHGVGRPSYEQPRLSQPTSLNGRGNGVRPAPISASEDDPGPAHQPPIDVTSQREPRARSARLPGSPQEQAPDGQATRPPPSSTPNRRRPLTASGPAEGGAIPVTERTRSGSALDRARQARINRSAASVPREPGASRPPARPTRAGDTASASSDAPALPVIVLIAVVVLLTLGVAYMVITGDGTSDPVDDQPGASTPSVGLSFDEA